jgi:hypothetical protein
MMTATRQEGAVSARPVKVRAWRCRGCGSALGSIRHQRGQQTRYTPDAAAVVLLWWQGRRLQFRCVACARQFGQLAYEVENEEIRG